MKSNQSYRMQKEELILRFFSFYYNLPNYSGGLATFLNKFMETNRFPSNEKITEMEDLFKGTIDIYQRGYQYLETSQKISMTIQEAICYGIAKNINKLSSMQPEIIANKMTALQSDSLFSEAALAEGLAKKQRLIERMDKAQQIME